MLPHIVLVRMIGIMRTFKDARQEDDHRRTLLADLHGIQGFLLRALQGLPQGNREADVLPDDLEDILRDPSGRKRVDVVDDKKNSNPWTLRRIRQRMRLFQKVK